MNFETVASEWLASLESKKHAGAPLNHQKLFEHPPYASATALSEHIA